MLYQLMGQLYDDVHRQMIAAEVPTCRNYGQQEQEIVCHFRGMWDDKQYDLVSLPASMPNKEALFTAEEHYVLASESKALKGLTKWTMIQRRFQP